MPEFYIDFWITLPYNFIYLQEILAGRNQAKNLTKEAERKVIWQFA